MEASFLTKLNLHDIDGEHWELLTPLVYMSKEGVHYTVPAGFITDLASIPRGLWNILPKTGKWDKAGVLHDWLYKYPVTETGTALDRGQVDGLFKQACESCGVGKMSRNIIYAGVRVGGWKPWGKYREEEKCREEVLGNASKGSP